MNLIDMHCDTIWKLMELGGKGDLMVNDGCISIEKMRKADTKAQFFALFTCATDYMLLLPGMEGKPVVPTPAAYEGGWKKVLEKIEYFNKQTNKYGHELRLARNFGEMKKNESEGIISGFLTVEEAGILNGDLSRIDLLYEKGVRLMTLLWNFENCIGYPNSADPEKMNLGLKPFGKEALNRMDELGMIIDVSHSSDGVFWDVLKHSKGQIVASHSNCRTLCEHRRNLTDEMIRALAERGGVSGLNFYGAFLDANHPDESTTESMCDHVLHMIDEGGIEFPAIGTDFDGFDGMKVEEIPTVSEMEYLWYALKKKGLKESELDHIWYLNAERIIKGL